MGYLPVLRRRMACGSFVYDSYTNSGDSREPVSAFEGWCNLCFFGEGFVGAEVGQIVDALSFGWYESVFQSYMVSKPVKVVSSMGEQSVGKSFSLNHLVDTSFAGSAMRTTEGVWMSATPTNEALIVALDFEGVHSIERTAQEDTLLVLFNTAISNLVLFRNNFAISRSISGLFHSFQSSSTVLDPAANPQLFRSTLVIIIKNEIVREFSTKFQKIVEDEQDANFISRLHAGQLDIIPWPVIESRQFYTLFPALKKSLDRQEVTHDTAGEFLYTLKTLMAKLKANDWAALSQTLAGHRAQKLRDYLSNALEFGFCEMEPFEVPLKNFDTDKLIEKPDTASRFFISESPLLAADKKRERENILASLQQTWDGHGSRHQQSDTEWTKGLSRYLADLVQTRLEHVFEWISSNLSRFKSSHVNMELLRREYESAALELGSNVEICRMTCTSCHLLCILSRHHDTDQPHNCQTSHLCTQPCEYEGDHPDADKFCGYRAGHSGQHICVVEDHLCGEACGLKGKIGCLEECIKVFGHPADEGHICSARVHACGEPCHLKNIKLSESTYSCPRACAIPSDEDHTTHVCDTRSCPMPCDLCKRLCSNPDHLHGLNSDAVHLCGQQHNCPGLCAAEGICQIDTAPQSIEATFTGRHETFQYTKYSQVANRLPCVILIPSEEHHHVGPHKHSTDPAPFHFCETRCESCGYFCTLPRGHTQQEHATNHGSMSKTTWAVDGPDDAILEINGRNFASADDGAPMMCNLVCQEMGRHVHIDYCRAGRGSSCDDTEVEHIRSRVTPNPDLAKDWISHSLFWRRSGFKDPYARDDRANFAKCDAMCPGPEHIRSDPPQPSYCSLPIFHGRSEMGIVDVGQGYLSNDGHLFACKDPADMYQTFHVICVIDKSSSMRLNDRRPLQNTPWTEWIAGHSDNRLGAVYSALHAFWGPEMPRSILASEQQLMYRGMHTASSCLIIVLKHVSSTMPPVLQRNYCKKLRVIHLVGGPTSRRHYQRLTRSC
ncbi:hypothetical protein B0H10DRAFT_1063347 [Mycena sp. CBHHK59/15]|nr:hypothetical protein B0H10DRAFT_1063347 [Mycena sp. CBHHK59/15]